MLSCPEVGSTDQGNFGGLRLCLVYKVEISLMSLTREVVYQLNGFSKSTEIAVFSDSSVSEFR